MALGSLLLRTAVGGAFIGHGLQKLAGAFGGPGLEGATGMMRQLGLRPAALNARAAAWSETAGGAALVLGAATPAAAAALIGSMTTAMRTVHLRNGFWNANGGWELNGLLIAAAAAVVADGPGPVSVDGLLGRPKWGPAVALLALAAGVGASFAVTEASKRQPDEADPGAAPDAADAGEA